MRNILLLAALLGGCTGGSSPNDDDTAAPKAGTAFLTYDLTVMGETEACQINVACGDEIFSAPSGETIEVETPNTCVITAGIEVEGFDFPVHPDTKGEYWASPPISLELDANDDQAGTFTGFNLFKPGYYDCEYDKYELDESRSDLKGEQWMEDHPVDEQFIEVDQDGIVEIEGNNPHLDVVGGGPSYLQVIDDQLVLKLEDGEVHDLIHIPSSEIGNDFFSLTVVNTELGHVSDVRCERDE